MASGLLFKDRPLYVQFYITARCNLACKQCQIIYSNSDVREATLPEVERIADNLARIGTCVVLLTGGEPFVRKDLPDIIRIFTERRIHIRMQTNGLASEEALSRAVQAGGHDISISLDTLLPDRQDFLNGEVRQSFDRAMRTIAKVTQILEPKMSFASLGCVLSPHNLKDVPSMLRFAQKIGWVLSLVPAHIAEPHDPRGFRSFDRSMIFPKEQYGALDRILDLLIEMKEEGYPLYDSEVYLRDMARFIKGQPMEWRSRNGGICDSPTLYFAILPNGDLSVCCDHRTRNKMSLIHPDFPEWYFNGRIHREVVPIAAACDGCLYGSYPEITTMARFATAGWDHAGMLLQNAYRKKPWPVTYEQLLDIREEILHGVAS